jgi:hypothetical protein
MLLVAAAGCSGDPAPPEDPRRLSGPVEPAPPFDADLEPAEAVLALVPPTAGVVTVTDFDRVRAQLGVPDLTSEDPVSDRTAFWERAAREAPLLAEGVLRPFTSELMLDHGFTQDDVDWEAHFTGPDGDGWVLALRPDLDLDRVDAAIDAGVGPLAGAELREGDHLVVSGVAAREDGAWANDRVWDGLVGEPAAASYLRRGCVPVDQALGPEAGSEDLDRLLAAVPVTALDELPAFALGFGDHTATARMGRDRDDLFDRLDLARDWPQPDFGEAFRNGVGDPTSGRIGFHVPQPAVAARLTLLEELPFAICNEAVPIPEPTG